jgi:anti-sigma factor (TIGR02949 family)
MATVMTMPEQQQLDCDAVMAQLWDYLDQELTPERMTAVQVHLEICVNCLPHAQYGQRFLAALHTCGKDYAMPEALRERVMECLKREGLMS